MTISDSSQPYHTLKYHGYADHVISQSENFVHPENPDIYTQNIEKLWRDFKEWVKKPGHLDQIPLSVSGKILVSGKQPSLPLPSLCGKSVPPCH